MLSPLPATELALRGTVLTRAKLDQFNNLVRWYGMPRPTLFSVENWRSAAREAAMGARATRGVWHMFLEEALGGQFGETYVATIDPGVAHELTWVSGGVAAGWEPYHTNRLWRLTYPAGTDDLVYSVGPSFTVGPLVGGQLTFCPVRTAYWSRLDVTKVVAASQCSLRLLPFLWSDFDGKMLLTADLSTSTPPTYMQPAVRWGASTAGGVPASTGAFFPTDTGAEPPQWLQPAVANEFLASYTVTEETAGTWRDLVVTADIDPNNPAVLPARGDAHVVTVRWAFPGFVDTALTCSMGAADQEASDLVNTVVFAAGDIVGIRVVAGAAVTEPLRNIHISVNIERPVGQPKGGYILENQLVDGDQFLGPWPLYIGRSED